MDSEQFLADLRHLRLYMLLLIGASFVSPLAEIYVAVRMMRGITKRGMPGLTAITMIAGGTVLYSYLMLLHLGGLFHYELFAEGWLSEAWSITKFYPAFHARVFTDYIFEYAFFIVGGLHLAVVLAQWAHKTEAANAPA